MPSLTLGGSCGLEDRQQALDVVGDLDGVAAGLAHHGEADAPGALLAVLAAVDA